MITQLQIVELEQKAADDRFVHELKESIRRAINKREGRTIDIKSIYRLMAEAAIKYGLKTQEITEGFEEEFYSQLLIICKGNKAEIARRTGLSRSTLNDRITKLGIE